MRARRASSGGRGVWPFRSLTNRDLPCGKINDGRRNEEGRDATRPIVKKFRVLALDGPEISYAAADVSSNLFRILVRDFKATVFDGFVRGGDGVMNKGAHLARLFLLDVIERVEIFNFGSKLNRKLFRIELLDIVHAAATLHQRRPSGLNRVADRRNETNPRDHNATFQDEYSFTK